MTTHRGLSGKFERAAPHTAKELLEYARISERGCLLPPKEGQHPFGYFKKGVWYTAGTGYLIRETKKMSPAAHSIIYLAHNPNSIMAYTSIYRLYRQCKTTGCLNHEHYELRRVGEKGTYGEQLAKEYNLMSDEKLCQLYDKALYEDQYLTFATEEAAVSFRLHLYRIRRKWKDHKPHLYSQYEAVMIQKNKDKPNILTITNRHKAFDSVIEKALGLPPTTDHSTTREIATLPDHIIEQGVKEANGIDDSNEIIKNMFSTTPTYDSVYAKAALGKKLTDIEEAVLKAGPPSIDEEG